MTSFLVMDGCVWMFSSWACFTIKRFSQMLCVCIGSEWDKVQWLELKFSLRDALKIGKEISDMLK
jgi:hypothetical protein